MKVSIKKQLFIAMAFIAVVLVACTPSPDFGPEDWTHFIRKDSAEKWINRYDAKHESKAGRLDSNNLLLLSYADDFKRGKWMMGTMMAKKGITGFRIYYGIKFNDSIVPILVGLDTSGSDVYWLRKAKPNPLAKTTDTEDEEGAMDMSQKSPPPPMGGIIRMILPPRIRPSTSTQSLSQ